MKAINKETRKEEGGGMKDEEETFKKVFGESVEEARREMSEEGVGARARKVEAVSRSWRPHCAKGRAETCGHKKRGDGGDVPTVRLDYMYTRSEQEKEEEKGTPIIVVKDNKKMLIAKVVPNKGVNECAVEVVRSFVEQLGHNKVILKGDNELAILALKEAARRERRAWRLRWRRHLWEIIKQVEWLRMR